MIRPLSISRNMAKGIDLIYYTCQVLKEVFFKPSIWPYGLGLKPVLPKYTESI
jgi:hypothetical protein